MNTFEIVSPMPGEERKRVIMTICDINDKELERGTDTPERAATMGRLITTAISYFLQEEGATSTFENVAVACMKLMVTLVHPDKTAQAKLCETGDEDYNKLHKIGSELTTWMTLWVRVWRSG